MFVYTLYTPCTVVTPHPKPPNNARTYSRGRVRGAESEREREGERQWELASVLASAISLARKGVYQARPAGNRARQTALGAKRIQRMPRWLHATFAPSLSLSHSLSYSLERAKGPGGWGGLARNRARSAKDTNRNVQSFSRAVLVRSFVAFVRFWFSIRLCFSFENIHL